MSPSFMKIDQLAQKVKWRGNAKQHETVSVLLS
jgi:hypothetical protein